jgi:transposase-like protein
VVGLPVAGSLLESARSAAHIHCMKKSDVICPECGAGYRRIELISKTGSKGEYRCLLCDHVLEVFDGSTDIAIRLTVQPEKIFE